MKLLKYNELNNSTYLSAIDKFRSYNQKQRSKNMENNLFREFIGREVGRYKITRVDYGYKDTLTIKLEPINIPTSSMPSSKLENTIPIGYEAGDPTIIYYSIKNDEIKVIPSINNKFERKLANVISKIILIVNPNTKYKSINNFNIIGY